MHDARSFQERIARAWPPCESEVRHGWLLHFSRGVTKRANSVLPLDGNDGAEDALSTAIRYVEACYARRGLAACFQMSPAAEPTALDAALDRRGYVAHDPTCVQTAAADDVLDRASAPTFRSTMSDCPSDAWLDVNLQANERSSRDVRNTTREILTGTRSAACFATVLDGGRVIAVGQGVRDGDFVGVQCMATEPDARRRGAAKAVLATIAHWALEGGSPLLYLCVVEANVAARSLYTGLGFDTRHTYWYRSEHEARDHVTTS